MSKKRTTQNIFSTKILQFLQEKSGKSFKSKDISRALKVDKSHYYLFREAFTFLIKQGKIVRTKNKRYTIPSYQNKIRGIVQVTKKGFGFVTDHQTGEEIFIPAPYLNTAFNGDQVEVQLFAVSKGKSKEGQISSILKRARQIFVGTYHHSEYYGFVVPDNPKTYRDFYIAPYSVAESGRSNNRNSRFSR